MKKTVPIQLHQIFIVTLLLLLVSTQIVSASCPINNRASWTTYWAFCNVASNFQSKTRVAISTWDGVENYNYIEKSPTCAYAFSWGQESFSAKNWGLAPGTTFLSYNSSGKVTSAVSYYNSDKSWYNSSSNGVQWPSGWYDRLTIALHETGHWMALHHPSVCSQNHPQAVMEPNIPGYTKWYLHPDDLNGLSQLGVR